MAQMKEQNNIPEKELNKMETSNLLDAKVKTLVIRMLRELKRGLQQHKKDPVRNEGYINEIKNNLYGTNRVDEAENQISSFEHKEAQYAQSEQ